MVTQHLVFFGFFPGAQASSGVSGAYAPGIPPLSFRAGFSVGDGTTGAYAPGVPPLSFRSGFTETADQEWQHFLQARHNVLLRM